LYGREACSLALREERTLRVLENIRTLEGGTDVSLGKTANNEVVHYLYAPPNLLGWSNQGGWDGRGMQHAWEKWEIYEHYRRKTWREDLGAYRIIIFEWIVGNRVGSGGLEASVSE